MVLKGWVLYGIGSDVLCMEQGKLRRDQRAVLLLTGYVRSAKPASAQPNRMRRREVQAMYFRVRGSE